MANQPCPRCGDQYNAARGYPCCWNCSQTQRARETACLYCAAWRPDKYATCQRHRQHDDHAAQEAMAVRARQRFKCLGCSRAVSPLHVSHLRQPSHVNDNATARQSRGNSQPTRAWLQEGIAGLPSPAARPARPRTETATIPTPPHPWTLIALCGDCTQRADLQPLDMLKTQIPRYLGTCWGDVDEQDRQALLETAAALGIPQSCGAVAGLVALVAGPCGRCGRGCRRYGSNASPLCRRCRALPGSGLEALLADPDGASWGEPVGVPLEEEDALDILACIEQSRERA